MHDRTHISADSVRGSASTFHFIIFLILMNSVLKQSSVSLSYIQNSIMSIGDVLLFCLRNLSDSWTSIFAHLSLGNPKIPELIAGIEILLNPLSAANARVL